jgi:hypothetical protein
MYARLARLAPAGLAELRSGDLLARLVGDVDGLADLWLRVMLPYGSLAVVGGMTVFLVGWLVPGAGLALAVGLLLRTWGRRWPRRSHDARGIARARRLADAALDLLRAGPRSSRPARRRERPPWPGWTPACRGVAVRPRGSAVRRRWPQ